MALTSDPSDPEHSVSKSALEAAHFYLKIERPQYALKLVAHLVNDKDRLDFYLSECFVDEAIALLLKCKPLRDVYRIMKGNNWFEEGARVALERKDIENHITFVLLAIKEKLWCHDASYTEIAKRQDIEKLQLLEKQTDYWHTKEQINHYIVVLKNNFEEYKNLIDVSNGFMRSITFDAFLNAFKSKIQVIPIIKNLGFLLKIHIMHQHSLDYVDVQIRKFYHIKTYYDFHSGEDKSIFPPIMLQTLQTKRYEIDALGTVVMPLKELKQLLNRHTRSIAKSWLKVLNELLGKNDQSIDAFMHCFKVKDMIKTLRYCSNLISCKFYYEQFEVSYAKDLDYCVTEIMLINVLSLPWICYAPKDHRTVEVFLRAPVIARLLGQCTFSNEWAFQGNINKFYNLKKFAKQRIDYYHSSFRVNDLLKSFASDSLIGPFVSELEIITIGLLGIFSVMNNHYCLVIPQSYEVVTEWFNCNKLFSILRKTSIKCEEVLDFLFKIINLLLGNDPFTNILAKTYTMEYKNHYPIRYQFERCFVLVLTLFGNLAPLLEDNIKLLFQSNLKAINKISSIIEAKNTSHPKKFRHLINEAANATTTDELHIVVYKIQKLYFRKMVKFNIQVGATPFEVVKPIEFPCFLLYPAMQDTRKEKN